MTAILTPAPLAIETRPRRTPRPKLDGTAELLDAIRTAPDRTAAEAAYLKARAFWQNGPDDVLMRRFRTEVTTAAAIALP